MYWYRGWISLFDDLDIAADLDADAADFAEEEIRIKLAILLDEGSGIFNTRVCSMVLKNDILEVSGHANRPDPRRGELLEGLTRIATMVPSAAGIIYDHRVAEQSSDPQSGFYTCYVVRRGSVTVIADGHLPPLN